MQLSRVRILVTGGLRSLGIQVSVSTLLLLAAASQTLGQVSPDAGMLRYPDVSAEKIVFVYSGDLWTVPREGGLASPLASPAGEERNPRFNADGTRIAFVGHYDAGADIYVSPTAGGVAERMTFHPASETLCDWTSQDGLLFSSNGFSGLGRMDQLFTITPDEPFPVALPVPYGSNGAISPDGVWLAYTPYSRDGRTWKRYRGGMASDIWLLHLESKRSKQITDWEGTDSVPMWHGQNVYYLSDAGPNHRLNIWKYDTNSGAREQITQHADFDVKWPSIGPGPNDQGEIVYQQGSDLWLLDLKTKDAKTVDVQIPGDQPRLRKQLVDVSEYITSASISPSGKRVAIEARGDIWTVPAKNGTPRKLTSTSGIAERYPAWSPDGRWIAYLSDATGEYELVMQQSDGRGETRRLTDDGTHWRYAPVWSPDSKMLFFTDKTGTIFLHDIAAKQTKQVDREPTGNPPSVCWSHDSRWLAYDKTDGTPSGNAAIWLYELDKGESQQLTSGYFNDAQPAFDRQGDFLYYTSNRRFSNPRYEDVGSSFIYEDTAVLLALPLRQDVENPLLLEVDEVTWSEDDAGEDDSDEPSDSGEESEDSKSEDSDSTPEDDDDEDDNDEPEANADPISGSWTLTVNSELIPAEARTVTLLLELAADGSISGSVQTPDGDTLGLGDPKFDAATGEFSASVATPMGEAKLAGTVSDGTMTGTVTISVVGLVADFSAVRDQADSGEKTEDKSDDDSDAKSDKSKKKDIKPLVIDVAEAERRVIPLPVGPGNFRQLVVNNRNQLIYLRIESGSPPAIKIFDITADKPKEETIVSGGGGYELSADGKKLLLMRGSAISITDAAAGKGAGTTIKTSGMTSTIDPREEWKQVFVDAWRLERDFFYDPNMHGVDWKAVRTRYENLLKDASSRSDVGFIIAEMISELNVGHAYYRGISDDPAVPSSDTAVLGCRLEPSHGRFKIAEFWQGGVWDTDAQNPLQVAGAKVGQYILEVEGRELTTDVNPYSVLAGLAGDLVTIVVSDDDKLDDDDKRIYVRLPGSDSDLRFRHWIEKNRAYVAEKSGGKIGYIFVTNTGQPGQNDLFRQFYAQLGKEALIIDDRWNGGGQIPTRFIELLNRPATNYWARRDGQDWRWPRDSHQGPKCMLINGLAGSGGDMFPALFRQAKLGKLIGRRTWGGLVGITGGPSLIDGASVTVPSFAYYELDGTWGIEGHGVDPDIEVIDDPALMHDGGDPQLDAAIAHLQQALQTAPFVAPKRPPYPNRNKMGLQAEDR